MPTLWFLSRAFSAEIPGDRGMINRWSILAVLFAIRFTMAFQFESVAAVAPLLRQQFGIGLAEIGLLIGLYFTPGVALALPGGAIGRRFGDKPVVFGALALMMIGSLLMGTTQSWNVEIAGRLIAGAGGVLLNVEMTKMTVDWFAGKEIATAMAILVNSWPAGVALALLTLPLLGTSYGVGAAHLAVAALMVLGLLLALVYRPPPNAVAAVATSERLDRAALVAVTVAGVMWGLFNVGFAIIFSFGPSLLVERGWSIASAGSAISIVLWLAVLSVPGGGFVADRLRRPQLVLVAGCVLFAASMLTLPRHDSTIAVIVVLGLICGQPAGPILSLPAQVLAPANRAIGMGIFYTLYYVTMMLGPIIGGACAKWAGSAEGAFDFGALTLLACPLLLLGFNRIAQPVPATA
jgi:predicted MFS family arabinose efflux permease